MSAQNQNNLTRQNSPSANLGGQVPRPPVVVIMGHVDHGKTKLLDYIRKTSVAEKEAGGITQHIGAYEITYKNRKITFLDTPGHEAFSKIRARGANVADIAVLVVAADDGVKPQTVEALEHIKKAGLPFIVAINKIDKPEANPEKVKKELAEHEVLVESWGGKVPSVEISAKQGLNINELLDLIELLADLGELKAGPNKPAEGVVIETNLDPRRGFVVSLLILNGTMEVGDYILSGSATGKIKILEDFRGEPIKKATFSSPVLAVGFRELPLIGDKFVTEKIPFTPALKAAKKIGDFIEKSLTEEKKEGLVYAVIKADVQSSVEALKESLEKIKFENANLRILKAEAGNINESDFKTARISDAIIIGFNVKIGAPVVGENEKITVVSGDVIYKVIEETKTIIEGRTKPKAEREEMGRLQVLAVFRQEKNRQVIGGKVLSGEILKNARFEALRNDIMIVQGRITSLQSDKKETGKVEAGKEAGLEVDFGEPKLASGDTLVLFKKLS